MDGLFSHAALGASEPPAGAPQEASVSAVDVLLPLSGEEAAIAWTEYLHLFWPVEAFSASAEGAHVWWDAEQLGEEAADGELITLAQTTEWDLPRRAVARFVIAGLEGMQLSVEFSEESEGTRVSISGPDDADIPSSLTDGEGAVWPRVANRFARFVGAGA